MRLLQGNPELSRRNRAAAVGIRLGAAHYVLSALIEAGLVKPGNFSAATDKRRYATTMTELAAQTQDTEILMIDATNAKAHGTASSLAVQKGGAGV